MLYEEQPQGISNIDSVVATAEADTAQTLIINEMVFEQPASDTIEPLHLKTSLSNADRVLQTRQVFLSDRAIQNTSQIGYGIDFQAFNPLENEILGMFSMTGPSESMYSNWTPDENLRDLQIESEVTFGRSLCKGPNSQQGSQGMIDLGSTITLSSVSINLSL